MKETAISRMPVEIWCYIFQLAIETRYHIYNNPSIVEDLRLFDWSCEPYRILKDSDEIKANLRLVCRSWNVALKHSPSYFASDLEAASLPSKVANTSAYRIHITQYLPCICGRTPCQVKSRWNRFSFDTDITISLPQFSEPEVLLITCNDGVGQDLIQTTPNSLKILSFGVEYLFSSGILHSEAFQRLTHLRFTEIGLETVKKFDQYVTFPVLHMLWLDMYVLAHDEEGVRPVFSTWKIPQLRRISLYGCCYGSPADDLLRFLIDHSKTITDLVLFIGWFDEENDELPWTGIEPFWPTFPRLSLLGTILNNFRQGPPSPDTYVQYASRPLEVLILDFPFPSAYRETIPFFSVSTAWVAQRIVFQLSWNEIRRRLEGCHPDNRMMTLERTRELLQQMAQLNVPLCDGEQIALSEPRGQLFHVWLLNACEATLAS